LQIEEIANELSRTLGDYDRVRLCNALQASRDVRRLTDDAALLRLARSDQVADYDQPGSNPYAGLQGSAELQSANRLDQLQPSPYRPLGVILVGLRKAEVNQYAVTHILRDEPADALHSRSNAFLIGRNDLA
jgi:hypothetical protein